MKLKTIQYFTLEQIAFMIPTGHNWNNCVQHLTPFYLEQLIVPLEKIEHCKNVEVQNALQEFKLAFYNMLLNEV